VLGRGLCRRSVLTMLLLLILAPGCSDDSPTVPDTSGPPEEVHAVVGPDSSKIELDGATAHIPEGLFKPSTLIDVRVASSVEQNPPPVGVEPISKAVKITVPAGAVEELSDSAQVNRVLRVDIPAAQQIGRYVRATLSIPGQDPVPLYSRIYSDTERVEVDLPLALYGEISRGGAVSVELQAVAHAMGRRSYTTMQLYHATLVGGAPSFSLVSSRTTIPAGKYPLVLIHGMNPLDGPPPPPQDYLTGYWSPAVRQILSQSGQPFDVFCLIWEDDSWLSDEAAHLRGLIDDRFGSSQQGRVLVIAHSMGCLLARSWMVREGGGAFVRGAALIDGPNHGSALADYTGTWLIPFFLGQIEVRNLRFDNMVDPHVVGGSGNSYLRDLNRDDHYWDRYVVIGGTGKIPVVYPIIDYVFLEMHWTVPENDSVIEYVSQVPSDHIGGFYGQHYHHDHNHLASNTSNDIINYAFTQLRAMLPPTDTTPPARIGNLAVQSTTQTSVTLTWTATGDDGNQGTATSYDLRRSSSVITESNFSAATQVTGVPGPRTSGQAESFSVTGLSANTTYYFAIKAKDDVNLQSPVSNAPYGTTQPVPDTIVPSRIGDLRVSTTTANSISLAWTAPGDDGDLGQARKYDLRRSTSPITAQNWNNATQVTTVPDPATSGYHETYTVSGLVGDTMYYFALKARDEVLTNWSEQSNVADGSTQDNTPPAAVTNLAASEPTSSSVRLTWTAPGDNGNSGTAHSYSVHYSTSPITGNSWGSATHASGEPTPRIAGTSESFVVTGLQPSTTYYFGIKTTDDVNLTSGLSNVPFITTTPPPDPGPPAAITSLAVGTAGATSIELTWSAPGDDGNSGTATSYEVRYSTGTINEANWSAATQADDPPTPQLAGSTESFSVPDLLPSTVYSFAIKTRDEVGNLSPLSNVVSQSTLAADDVTRPAAVTSLAADSSTATTVLLTWIAPGDDGDAGQARQYDVRYSRSVITSGNWGSATTVIGEPLPQPAGAAESFLVTGLLANTTYYFALKTQDEVPNTSLISNVPSKRTAPPPDTTPPSAVTNLSASGIEAHSLTLTWKASGDDGMTGTATEYDVRYSTSSITNTTWDAATPATEEPNPPHVAGTTEHFTVTGLVAGTKYYFAMKTRDEVPNWSGISNVRSATTLTEPDTWPPSTVMDLAAGSATPHAVTLTWTAPSDPPSNGAAAGYDVRYSTSTISLANWDAATPASGEPTPHGPGTTEMLVVSGLSSATTYYFAVRSVDGASVPNWSELSNVASIETVADLVAPATVTDLHVGSVGSTAVLLQWTAPGDDGATGTIDHYDLRRSSEPITEENFESATPAGSPAPVPGGSQQAFDVTGLAPSTSYYFALKAVDASGNWSALSQPNAHATTEDPDEIRPARIEDLAAGTATAGTLTLSWTAVGDDSLTGRAAAYDIRFSADAGTTWDEMSVVLGEPAPRTSGERETFVVHGLWSNTLYTFQMRVRDEASNWSDLSNQASGQTLDGAPPADVSDLAVGSPTASSLTLSWTAVGDDGIDGTASQYDIRLSMDAGASWSEMTPVVGEPLPKEAGQPETLVVPDLEMGTVYYFQMKVADEIPNWSGLSNEASGATVDTSVDSTPPSVVADLSAGSPTLTSLALTWTAVGDDGSDGTASQYDIRYSTDAGTIWDDMTPVDNEPAPSAAGETETLVVSGLAENTAYFFQIRVADEVPNWSDPSTQAGGQTASPGTVNVQMTFVEGGSFQMGNTFAGEGDPDELPVHTVTLSDFSIGTYSVTFAEYDAFCDATHRTKPSDNGWGRGNRPVMRVTWADAQAFCDWYCDDHGVPRGTYRLPTEAEWEYAARSRGQAIRYPNGATIDYDHANYFASSTEPVGSYPPNALGLYDMAGNCNQWVSDWYGSYSSEAAADPTGPATGDRKCFRGGSWSTSPVGELRCVRRARTNPTDATNNLGFRLAMTTR
jgi:formylglycine-generating enzyme required for sulfatase activity